MKVHICKTKKDLIMDNFNMIFSGKRKFFFGGAVIIGLVLSFMGRNEGLIILIFSLAFLVISALFIFSILRKIKGDKLELTYELDGKELKVQNPMGVINVNTIDIVTIEENKDFYLLEIKNSNERNTKLPLYKTGVVEGEIGELINNIKVDLNKEYEDEENIEVEKEINDEKSADSDDEIVSEENDDIEENDNIEENEMEEEKQKNDMNEIEIEVNNEIKKEDNNDIEIENNNEIEIIEKDEDIKVSKVQEKEIEEETQVNKVDTYEIRNIVRFKNKFRNDFKRSFKMQFSRVSLILFIFTAITMGIISFLAESKVLGTVIIVVGILSIFYPILQVYSMRKNMKGIKSIGIDENDDIVIDNGILKNVFKKKNVVVGKMEDGEIIVSVLSKKSTPFGIKEEEIVEGDPYELFKLLKIGKVREFNWLGLFALGLATIGMCQIPLILGWTKINEPATVTIIAIVCVVISIILAAMAIFKKGKVKKQANWAILFDIIMVVFFVWTYLKK
ncbi:hypothetical protein [Oceanirhabdus seepicola]|uniref:Uncharacterized protein n=1 Tax=Oceanirhabdus seepicola TaxID=2828781 RepID=A0A9J6P0L5_9CLOT|nr:hypothetical protein [Oceanirhabdus seepicola]MCM1989734.1 hypothetical protein [Oceanirhabdus seepicola]